MRFRHDVMHAERLEDGAHRAAGDNAGTGWSSAQHDASRAVSAGDIVVQRATFAQRHANQSVLCRLRRLADCLRNFARLAVAETDPALLIADDDERGETEAAAALHHFRDAVDMDQTIDEFAIALVPVAATAAFAFTCHQFLPSSLVTCAAGSAARFECFSCA